MDHGQQRKEKRQGDSDQVKALDTVNPLLQLLSTHKIKKATLCSRMMYSYQWEGQKIDGQHEHTYNSQGDPNLPKTHPQTT